MRFDKIYLAILDRDGRIQNYQEIHTDRSVGLQNYYLKNIIINSRKVTKREIEEGKLQIKKEKSATNKSVIVANLFACGIIANCFLF